MLHTLQNYILLKGTSKNDIVWFKWEIYFSESDLHLGEIYCSFLHYPGDFLFRVHSSTNLGNFLFRVILTLFWGIFLFINSFSNFKLIDPTINASNLNSKNSLFGTLRGHLYISKVIEVGGWSRKWQFSLSLCSENVLTYLHRWVDGSNKP